MRQRGPETTVLALCVIALLVGLWNWECGEHNEQQASPVMTAAGACKGWPGPVWLMGPLAAPNSSPRPPPANAAP
ncbi:MAG TPA: hypothetical protein VH062_35755 [Polyangiaceae bacterium]|nr:hypothetical protein [Polyangiaceae bacterium]